MNTVDVHLCILDDTQGMRYLVNANTKLTIDMPYRNIAITACHHVWIDTNTHGYLRVLCAKLFQERKIIDVELYS